MNKNVEQVAVSEIEKSMLLSIRLMLEAKVFCLNVGYDEKRNFPS